MNGKYQVGSGCIVTVTHDTPFIDSNVPRTAANSQDLYGVLQGDGNMTRFGCITVYLLCCHCKPFQISKNFRGTIYYYMGRRRRGRRGGGGRARFIFSAARVYPLFNGATGYGVSRGGAAGKSVRRGGAGDTYWYMVSPPPCPAKVSTLLLEQGVQYPQSLVPQRFAESARRVAQPLSNPRRHLFVIRCSLL